MSLILTFYEMEVNYLIFFLAVNSILIIVQATGRVGMHPTLVYKCM